MEDPDLNLLVALDVLLAEGGVTGAARKLGLSPSAMSRTLTRLRRVTGDPLLVRAGRGLAPTPRALALREGVRELVERARGVLAPQPGEVDPATIDRTFTLRANEGFLAMFAAPLAAQIAAEAPRARLRFTPKPDKTAEPLRAGEVDLEVGVEGPSAPELRRRLLFRDRFIGVARVGHPLLAGPVTAERYAACRHVVASRRGVAQGPVDTALAALGLVRDIRVVAPGFSDALRIARDTDLIALTPGSCLRDGDPASAGLCGFALPVPTPEIAVAALWHPRMDADPAHRWLRETLFAQFRTRVPGWSAPPKPPSPELGEAGDPTMPPAPPGGRPG